jgi:hypothetical protein
MSSFELHFKRIDLRISKIIKDIPYLLVFTKKGVYRVYFINLNIFKSYKNSSEYKCMFFELFDLVPNSKDNKLFLGVGNYKHIAHMVPNLIQEKYNDKLVTYSMRMNGRPFKAFDISPVIDYYCFDNEKLLLLYSKNHKKNQLLKTIYKKYNFVEI